MISVNMGIEAVLTMGFPPAALGSPEGLDATPNTGSVRRADRTAPEGPAGFKAALRAAAENGKAGSAVSHPAPMKSASVISSDGETVQAANALESDDPFSETSSTEPAAEAQAFESIEPIGIQWIGSWPAASASKTSVSGAVEDMQVLSDAPAAEDDVPQECTELLDPLSRLRHSLAGESAGSAVLSRQLSERIESIQLPSDNGPASRVGEVLADGLGQLSDAQPAAALDSSTADGEQTAAQPLGRVDGGEGGALPGLEAAVVRRSLEVAEILPAPRHGPAQLREGDAALPNNGTTTASAGEASGAPTGTAAGLPSTSGPTDSMTLCASAPLAPQALEGARGNAEPESTRLTGAASDRGAMVPESRQEASAESDDLQHSADDSLHSTMPATATPAAGEGEALPEDVAALIREARWSPAAEGGLEKTAESPPAARDKETIAGSGRAGVFDQIVQRAAVQLTNDQGEINIDLKPDFLGRVRMQILTENQQVTVRILTELAAVRDMIENGLHQLKSELQSQGLQVERLEVAVADDHRQRSWQQAPGAATWKTPAAGDASAINRPELGEDAASRYYRLRPSETTNIDMFV